MTYREVNMPFGDQEYLKYIINTVKEKTKVPENFLSVQNECAETFKTLLKLLYNEVTLDNKEENNREIPDELFLEDMDDEQIWQQLELRNQYSWDKAIEGTSKLLSLKRELFNMNFDTEIKSNTRSLESYEVNSMNSVSDANVTEIDTSDVDEDKIQYNLKDRSSNKYKKNHSVEDRFFKLHEMEEFLKLEEEKEKHNDKLSPESDNSIDYFNNSSNDDLEDAKYGDFFDDEEEEELSSESLERNRKKSIKKRQYSEIERIAVNTDKTCYTSEESSSDEKIKKKKIFSEKDIETTSEENEGKGELCETQKSSYEQGQERLHHKIEKYEENALNALNEKPWQLKGEVMAGNRPQNSLLEEILEFDATTRPAPIITEETTLRLEDIIRQRIKDKAWDDVEKKFKPIQTPQEFKKNLVLNQEKSKESLAQIYEKEYRSQLEKLDPNADNPKEEPKEHKEIKDMMKLLFIKLDALSNFHYTPKPIAPEPKIVTNMPAIQIEEVAPVGISTAKLLAPEEIKYASGDIIGKSERTRTDKNRERRKKKTKQKFFKKISEERKNERSKLGIITSQNDENRKLFSNVIKKRNVKKANTAANAKTHKSSKTFFTELQEQIRRDIPKTKNKWKKEDISAKKLKL